MNNSGAPIVNRPIPNWVRMVLFLTRRPRLVCGWAFEDWPASSMGCSPTFTPDFSSTSSEVGGLCAKIWLEARGILPRPWCTVHDMSAALF
jgi:hypothetical protein